jgi:hypothetical protein
MKIDRTRFLLTTTAIAALVVSCSDSHPAGEHGAGYDGGGPHSSQYPACDAIIKACHMKDVGAGPVNDCHSLAHEAAGDQDCVPKKDACLKTCQDAVVDAGATDAADGGG